MKPKYYEEEAESMYSTEPMFKERPGTVVAQVEKLLLEKYKLKVKIFEGMDYRDDFNFVFTLPNGMEMSALVRTGNHFGKSVTHVSTFLRGRRYSSRDQSAPGIDVVAELDLDITEILNPAIRPVNYKLRKYRVGVSDEPLPHRKENQIFNWEKMEWENL